MSRSQRRAAVIALVVLLGGFATLVVIKRFVLDQEWWQSDHTTTVVAPASLSRSGPPAGPLLTSWHLSTQAAATGMRRDRQVSFGVVADQLLVASANGFDVRDAGTGKPRWHYRRSTWVLLGWASTNRSLIGYFERENGRGTHLMIGFDAASGLELWRSSTLVPPTLDRQHPRWPAWGDTVLAARGPHTLVGLGSRTGDLLWTRSLPGRCALPRLASRAMSGGGDTAVLVARCPRGGGRVFSFDPETGHVLWTRRAGDPAATRVDTRGGVSEVWDGRRLQLVDSDGDEVLSRSGAGTCARLCPFTTVGPRTLVAYHAEKWYLDAIDTRRSSRYWRQKAGRIDALTAAGGVVYALRPRIASGLTPAAIDTYRPGSGDSTIVPLLLSYGPGTPRPWLETGGGLLYLAYRVSANRTVRLVALRGAADGKGADQLGGVPRAAWPDACKLLTDDDLAELYPGESLRSREHRMHVHGFSVNAPTSCSYRRSRPGDTVTISITWVARRSRDAARLLTSARAATPHSIAVPGLGDRAYRPGSARRTVEMRVGHVLVSVRLSRGGTSATRRVGKAVAAELRAQRAPKTPPLPARHPSR